jgi:phage terminase small subunit
VEDFLMAKKDVYNVPPIRGSKVVARTNTPVKPLKQYKSLKSKEWKFVQELVAGDGHVTMKEAAIRAGYRETSASAMAWKLTNPAQYPHVVSAIQAYRAELNSKYGTNYDRHMRDLQLIRDKALEAGAYGAAVQAEYRRGQALGTIYVDRKEIRHGSIDSMSKEEVERKLAEIKKIYGASIPAEIVEVKTMTVRESVEREIEPPFDSGIEVSEIEDDDSKA